MMTLQEYRKEQKIGQRIVASQLGVSQATVSKFERGLLVPSLELAFAIERLTAGAVPPSIWLANPFSEGGTK